jgi:hypothetical protein
MDNKRLVHEDSQRGYCYDQGCSGCYKAIHYSFG